MNWIVYADGGVLARSGIADPSFMIASPEVKVELNKAGSFQFTIFPMHPYYDQLVKMKTKIDVVLNGENIFSGRVLYTQTDMYKQRKVYCEGCLSYLLDTVQESYEFNSKVTQFYDMTVYEFLDRLIVRHDKMFITDRMGILDNFQSSLTNIGIPEGNTDTTERLRKALQYYNNERSLDHDVYHIDDDTKMFKLGTVNAEGTSERFKFEIKGHKKTLDMILETLVDSVGGFMRAYRDPDDGWYVLEWRDKFGNENTQPIEFGSNLIDLQQDESGIDTFTRLYPSGNPSSGSGVSTKESTICLRETKLYFPVPESLIVYDDEYDTHEPGTEITVPKDSNFCELIDGVYVTSQDQEAVRGKQYYLPIYGDPLTLKVDDILNYVQVYMGDFNAISVRIDTLGLNGNLDIANYPQFVMNTQRSDLAVYDYADGTVLVATMDQNGTTYDDSNDYMDNVRAESGGKVDKMKSKDSEKRIVHVIVGNSQAYHNKVDVGETDNPKDLGYYEYSNNTYVLTDDTTPVSGKSYYVHSMAYFIDKVLEYSEDWHTALDEYFPDGATPASLGYFEVQQYGYVATEDTKVVRNKNYYYLRDPEHRSHNEEKYGVIVRAVEFSDVNGVNEEAKQHELYRRAVDYIQKNCTDLPEQITLTAIDLRNLDVTAQQMSIGRDIHVKSKPHDIDRHMKCISIDYYLDAPDKNVYVISSKPTGSDAIPKFTEQAETKKKKGSDGSSVAGGGTGGSYGGGDNTEGDIEVLKNHVFYSYGDQGSATMYGSYNQFFAKALGMQLDENGNPIVDIEGNWAWDGVTAAGTTRNTIMSQLFLKPNAGSLISEVNAVMVMVDLPEDYSDISPRNEGWYELYSKVEWPMTDDEALVTGKTYYTYAGHEEIEDPSSLLTPTYTAVSNPTGKNPKTEGWYEKNGDNYTATTDETPVEGKTYYIKKQPTPKSLKWRERNERANYKETMDTKVKTTEVDGRIVPKSYYKALSGNGEKILSSFVEVHPDSVIIESLNRPTYTPVENPQQTDNPKANRWYELDGSTGVYTRSQDTEPVSGKTYYTREVIASGGVEVMPGDVLIRAINQNNDSTITLDADQINFHGKLNFTSAGGMYLDADEIDASLFYKKIGGDETSYTPLVSERDIELYGLPFGFDLVDNQDGTYTASWEDYEGNEHSVTFNRATAITSLDGYWGSGVNVGKYIVVAHEDPSISHTLIPGLRLNGNGTDSFTAEITELVGQTITARKSAPGYLVVSKVSNSISAKIFGERTYDEQNDKYAYSQQVANLPLTGTITTSKSNTTGSNNPLVIGCNINGLSAASISRSMGASSYSTNYSNYNAQTTDVIGTVTFPSSGYLLIRVSFDSKYWYIKVHS